MNLQDRIFSDDTATNQMFMRLNATDSNVDCWVMEDGQNFVGTLTEYQGNFAPEYNLADVQRVLFDLGHYKDKIDGIYGMNTKAALLAFQREHAADLLIQNGQVDWPTYKLLSSHINELEPTKPPKRDLGTSTEFTNSLTDAGGEFIIGWEGDKLKPYKCTAGYWTIGAGHKLREKELKSGLITVGQHKISWRDGITKTESTAIFKKDTAKTQYAINKALKLPLTSNQFDALCSIVHHCGVGMMIGKKRSGMVKGLNAGDMSAFGHYAAQWNKKDGKHYPPFDKRRAAEIALFYDANYSGRP